MLLDLSNWNHILINSIFSVDNARKIVRIPISLNNQADKLVWSGEVLGIYSVRNKYRRLIVASNLSDLQHNLFKYMWRLQCQEKIKIL